MSRRQRGGVLWDAFLIVLVCAGGFVVWKTRDRWEGVVWKTVQRFWPGSQSVSSQRPVADLKPASASAQARLRDILGASGIKEKDIASALTEQRRDPEAEWLESTVELNRPKTFKEGIFLQRALTDVSKNGMALMKDHREKGVWTVEFGDRIRVFQRFRFRGPS